MGAARSGRMRDGRWQRGLGVGFFMRGALTTMLSSSRSSCCLVTIAGLSPKAGLRGVASVKRSCNDALTGPWLRFRGQFGELPDQQCHARLLLTLGSFSCSGAGHWLLVLGTLGLCLVPFLLILTEERGSRDGFSRFFRGAVWSACRRSMVGSVTCRSCERISLTELRLKRDWSLTGTRLKTA